MSILEAIILGIIQGATEFLPVSSSGHLVLAPWWLGWDVPADLVFTIAVHLGTLVAVLIYFRQDWLYLLRGGITLLRTRSLADPASKLLVLLVIGSVPVGIIGPLLASRMEAAFSAPASAAFFLLLTAAFLLLSEWQTNRQKAHNDLKQLSFADALLIGIAQTVALVPGVSRSGSTIAAGLFRGLDRPDAARFSFLLGTPAILGAGLVTAIDMLQAGEMALRLPVLLVGFISAGVVGYAAIALLLAFLRERRLYVFALYCTIAGVLSLLAVYFGR